MNTINITDSHTNTIAERAERGEAELEKQLVFIDQYIEKHYAKFMDDQDLVREAIENAPESLTVALNNILANLAQGIAKGAQNQLQAVLADMVDWILTAKVVEEWERTNANHN